MLEGSDGMERRGDLEIDQNPSDSPETGMRGDTFVVMRLTFLVLSLEQSISAQKFFQEIESNMSTVLGRPEESYVRKQ